MTAVLRALRSCWSWISGLVLSSVAALKVHSRNASARTVAAAGAAKERLGRRWHSDTTYRRTLIAALTAITATLLPHPAAAAALGALLVERPTRPSPGRDPFLDD
jgi:hypothetical protein